MSVDRRTASAGAIAALVEEPVGVAGAALLVLLAMSMGLQSGTARRLAVPDLTTVVLTFPDAGRASAHDSPARSLPHKQALRRQ